MLLQFSAVLHSAKTYPFFSYHNKTKPHEIKIIWNLILINSYQGETLKCYRILI